MSELTDYDITEAMITMGGSFVSQLARLYRLADDQNRLRVKLAFPDIWAKYAELVKVARAQAKARA